MTEPPIPDDQIPVGVEFLEQLRSQEDRCEGQTLVAISSMGKRAPQCFAALGTLLSLLDRATCCWWGCSQDDHLIQRLLVRALNQSRAGIRLLAMGFYDEALGAARGIGEIVNLTFLFIADRPSLQAWKAASRPERMRLFGPKAVRIALQQHQLGPPIDEERYRVLSEMASHVTPATSPQAHNPSARPLGPGYFQEIGVLLCLNEISRATALLAAPAIGLLDIPLDKQQEITNAGRALLDEVGGVTIEQLEDLYDQLRVLDDQS